MNGKVAIVTGATNGIGEVAALELTRMGATVVLISRSQSRLDNTVARIKAETGNESITSIQANLSSMAEVRRAAEEFLQAHDRLDVLLNNAGALFLKRQTTVDGYEMTFALNHLSYFLLTHLLLDTLKATADKQGEARIVNVSSNAHVGAVLNFEDLQHENGNFNFRVYGESKLMNVLFTYELARRMEGSAVTANVLHPGLVNTGFGTNNKQFGITVFNFIRRFIAKTSEQGAETLVYLASSPAVKGINGKYWVNKTQKRSTDDSYDVNIQQRLWNISEQLTGITNPVQT